MLPPVAAFAPAKVNLTLRVTGRRADGYHLLESLVVFAGVGDRLTVRPAPALSLAVSGPFGAGLAGEGDNLVLRAARRLAEAAGMESPGFQARGALTLEKILPLASGIGGGSSDAAAALRLLANVWGVVLPAGGMERLALALGADVPVCLSRLPARMAGIGEVLSPVPTLPMLGMVLVNPGTACPTAAIFRARAGMAAGFSPADAVPGGDWSTARAFAASLAASANDLEAPALTVAPVIGTVMAAIRAQPDCLLARMSGSGATCFGLFPDAASAVRAASGLTGEGWWSWGGGLYDPASAAL